jgi:hypothetical protein
MLINIQLSTSFLFYAERRTRELHRKKKRKTKKEKTREQKYFKSTHDDTNYASKHMPTDRVWKFGFVVNYRTIYYYYIILLPSYSFIGIF